MDTEQKEEKEANYHFVTSFVRNLRFLSLEARNINLQPFLVAVYEYDHFDAINICLCAIIFPITTK